MTNDRIGARRLRAARGVALLTAAVIAFAPAAGAAAGAAPSTAAPAVPASAKGTAAPFREDVVTAGTDDADADAAVDAAVDRYLAEYLRVHRTPGLVQVTLADGAVRVRVHGTTGSGAPVGEDTPMRIGSMSKAFTALAVLQQVDAGRFELDDPVAGLLPEFRLADDRYRSITVEHLLTHRSGLAATGLEYAADPASAPAETVGRLAPEKLAAAPGTTTMYSNAGYAVLARLVERTAAGSGAPGEPGDAVDFDEYLERNVFEPLGLTSTTVTERCDTEPAGLDRGFSLLGPARVAVPELPLACAGSGGIVSTARDMTAWLRFQVGDGASATGERLLRAETFRAFHDVPASDTEYGYGWHGTTAGDDDAPLVGHGGTLATFASGIELSPRTGTGAVVLANAAGDPMALTHDAVVAVDGGTPLPMTNPFDPFNAVVVGLAALALLAGVLVVVRSRRWAERRAAGSRRATVLRLVPLALVTLLGAALPWLGATLMGLSEPVAAYRVVLWLYPAVVLLGLALVLGAGGGLAARLVRLGSAPARPTQA
ncbi:serine hydrolase domain-containing protein [Promicromonospora sp. NPDC090134]|uniref:serine hydrolase domain-containing protein n=1 Tax=Promicromonospora sp. NPDC090134 TaxID=3364408 RepID=UPI0037F9B1CF